MQGAAKNLRAQGLYAVVLAGAPDVAALLWAIARLRGTVLYADHLQRIQGTLSGPQDQVLDALRMILVDEPCVKEFPRLPRVHESIARGGDKSLGAALALPLLITLIVNPINVLFCGIGE